VGSPESDEELAVQLVERAPAEGLELPGPNHLFAGLTRRVLETALETELTAVEAIRHGLLGGSRWRGRTTR
jgi:hypothetical protein